MRDAVGNVASVLVLGGGSDIGTAVARRLAAPRRARVVLAGRDLERLAGPAQALRDAGAGSVETALFDADDTDAHPEVVARLFAGGDLDVVVLAAGVLGDQRAAERDSRVAVEILTTNFVGCASAALCAAQQLRAQGHGTLVVLSSVAGERVRRSNFVYGSSKAGLDGFALGLADSLVGTGVRVVVVRPGVVRTKMTRGRPPAPFTCDPEDVAAAVDDAIRRGGEIVWVPRVLRLVMATLRHLPRPVFRRLPL